MTRSSLVICLCLGCALPTASGQQAAPALELRVELAKDRFIPFEEIELLVTAANLDRVPVTIAAADPTTTSMEFEVVYADTGAPAEGGGRAGLGPRGRPVPEWRKVDKKAARGRAAGKRPSGTGRSGGKAPAAGSAKTPVPGARRLSPRAGGLGPPRPGPRADVLQPGEAAAAHWELLEWTGDLQPARYALRVVWATNDTVIRTSWVQFTVAPFTAAEAEAWEQHMGVFMGPSRRREVERGIAFLERFTDSVFRIRVRRRLLEAAVRTQQFELAAEVGRGLYADPDWLAYRWPTPYLLGHALGRLGLQEELDRLLADLTPDEARQIREKLLRPDD